MQFHFATVGSIDFGAGTLNRLPARVSSLGSHAFLVRGEKRVRSERAVELLRGAGIKVSELSISREPSVRDVEEGVARMRKVHSDVVIGLGGGSAIDTAKAIAALAVNPGCVADYLEVVGGGMPLVHDALPCIAIPTTSGTGSEVTQNAVLGVAEAAVKVSLRHRSMLPRCAIVDPELTLSVPADTTASTGCDALTQVIEPLVSRFATPLTDALCRDAIGRAALALPRVCEQGSDLEARTEMALVSLFGGLSLANAKLGAVHGFAAVIGGRSRAPHGQICAALLAPTMDANIAALNKRSPGAPALSRYAEVARLLCRSTKATAEDGSKWVRDLVKHLKLPTLSQMGVKQADLSLIAEKSKTSSSMKGNPILLDHSELLDILHAAI